MKKILALVLACVLLLTALPALADNVRTSGLYTYEIKGNGTITITDFDWKANGDADIYIPNLIDGYTVTGIGDGAFRCYDEELTSKNADDYFDDYIKDVSVAVTIPDTIKTIGTKAFWLSNISTINIPNSVGLIGEGAFAGCSSCLFKVAPNQTSFAVIDEGLYNKSKKELIAFSGEITNQIDSIGLPRSFVTIPNGILSIGAYALAGVGCDKVELPSTLVTIGDYAFVDVYVGDGFSGFLTNLKTIGEGAFQYCDIRDCHLTMPAVETIGKHAFESVHILSEWQQYSGNEVYCIDFTASPLNMIDDAAFACKIDGGYFENEFIIKTADIESIGNGNWGLGKLMTKASHISPELHTIPTGLNPKVTALPDTVTSIKTGAFTDKVTDFRLSSYLDDIAVDAFPKNSTFIVDAGSYAELWCSENGFGYSIEGQQDDLSWLNN